MKILFIFNNIALLHSMLANDSTSQSRGWGTMAAVVRWRPPMFIVFSWWTSMFNVFCIKSIDSYIDKGHQLKLRKFSFFVARSIWPEPTRPLDRGRPPDQAVMLFVGVECVYGHQKTPILWWWCIAATSEHFEGHTPSQPPRKTYPRDQGVLPDQADALDWVAWPPLGC